MLMRQGWDCTRHCPHTCRSCSLFCLSVCLSACMFTVLVYAGMSAVHPWTAVYFVLFDLVVAVFVLKYVRLSVCPSISECLTRDRAAL